MLHCCLAKRLPSGPRTSERTADILAPDIMQWMQGRQRAIVVYSAKGNLASLDRAERVLLTIQ